MSREKSRQARLAEKRALELYKAQVKELRPYLKYTRDYDLRRKPTPGQKAAISKAWKDYQELTSRPFKVFRPRKKSNLKIAQQFSRHEPKGTRFNVAFVPVADPEKAQLTVKSGKLKIKRQYVTEEFIPFDLINLIENPIEEIQRALEQNITAKRFIIVCGKYIMKGSFSRNLIQKEILRLMMQYNNEEANNYYGNWLFGILSFDYRNQQDFIRYRQAFEKERKRVLEKRKRERKRRKQKYGRK